MTTCNRIVTPASTFVAQPERCQRGVSQCLRGQLAALFAQDQARLAAGQEPLYLLSRWSKAANMIKVRGSRVRGRSGGRLHGQACAS